MTQEQAPQSSSTEFVLSCSLGEFVVEVKRPDEFQIRIRAWTIPGCRNKASGWFYLQKTATGWNLNGCSSVVTHGFGRTPVRYARVKQEVLPVVQSALELFITKQADLYLSAVQTVLHKKWDQLQKRKDQLLQEVEECTTEQASLAAKIATVGHELAAWQSQQDLLTDPTEDVTF